MGTLGSWMPRAQGLPRSSGLRRGLAVFPEQEKLLCLGAPWDGTDGGISSMPFTLIWDWWYSLCIWRSHHPLLPYLRERRMAFSRLFELPADVLSANERLFSTITLPFYPGRGKEGICASSSMLFFLHLVVFSLWCYGQAVGDNLGNRYYIAPVFIGTWTIYQKHFMKGLAPICPGKNHWTVLEPPYIIIVYPKGWKEERSRTPGGMKGRRAPLCLPCTFLTWPAHAQPQMYCKFCCPARKAKGFPFCPKSWCHLQRQGDARRDFIFRKSRLIPVLQAAAGALPVPVQCVPSSLFHSLSRGALVFRSLCSFPSSWNNTDVVQELMSAKTLSWSRIELEGS